MSGRLDGRVVLLTGGGSGLGRGLIERFLAEGAAVAALERDRAKVERLRAELGAAVLAVEGDIGRPDDSERAVAAALERYGRLDTLIGTAAITDYTPAFSQYDRDRILPAFDEVLRVNVAGHILTAMAARQALIESGGSIILTLSTSGAYPGGQGAVYSVSKAALGMVVKQLAYELAPRVRVNGVVPGVIRDSDIRGPRSLAQEESTPSSAFPGLAEAAKGLSPLRICPPAADYAGLYVLLASADGAVATGALLNWDTGIGLVGHGVALADSLELTS